MIIGTTLTFKIVHPDRTEYLKSLKSMERTAYERDIMLARVTLKLRGLLDKKIWETSKTKSNPYTSLTLKNSEITKITQEETDKAKEKGFQLKLALKVYLKELKNYCPVDIEFNRVILSATTGEKEEDKGAVQTIIHTNYLLTDSLGNTFIKEKREIDIVHPVRIYLLYKVSEALEKINFTQHLNKSFFINKNGTLTPKETIVANLEKQMDEEISNCLFKLLGYRELDVIKSQLKLEIKVNKEVIVEVKPQPSNQSKKLFSITLYLEGYVKDVKTDSLIYIRNRLEKVKYRFENLEKVSFIL